MSFTPARREALLEQWSLRTDGDPLVTEFGTLVPVLRDRSTLDPTRRAWLAYDDPRPGSEYAHLALRAWNGVGAVRLLAAEPSAGALLLERLDPLDAHHVDSDEACAGLGELVRDLERPALPQVPRLSDLASTWRSELGALPRRTPVAPRFVDQARALLHDLTTEPEVDAALVVADLRSDTVWRSASGRSWVAMPPVVIAGSPAYALATAVWERWDEAVATGDPRWEVQRRSGILAEAAEVDEDLLRAWAIVRVVVAVTLGAGGGVPPEPTAAATLLKALQPDAL